MKLGTFERSVLTSVAILNDQAYGATIAETLEALTGQYPSLGSVYTTLARLKAKGLVVDKLGEPTPVRGGRAKRYWRISGLGRRVLDACTTNLKRELVTGTRMLHG